MHVEFLTLRKSSEIINFASSKTHWREYSSSNRTAQIASCILISFFPLQSIYMTKNIHFLASLIWNKLHLWAAIFPIVTARNLISLLIDSDEIWLRKFEL